MNAMVKLGDIATLITKGTTPTTLGFSFVDAGINFFKIECIDEDGHLLPLKFAHIDTHCHEALKRSQLAENDILFSIAGAIGRTAIVPPDYLPANTNQALAIIRIPADRYNLRYILFALQSGRVAEQFEKQKQGVAQLNISLKNISDIEIPMPPEYEQDRIVRILDHVNTQISNTRKQLVYIDQLVKSRFIEMFGDPVRNDKGWPLAPLASLAEIKIGPFGSLLHKEDYVHGGHALVNPSHIIDGQIVTDNDLTVSEAKYAEMGAYHLRRGDIVLGRRGEMGRCAVVYNDGLLCGTGSLIIRPAAEMLPYFLQKIISYPTFKESIEDMAVGVTMMNLNVPIVSNFMIPLLPLEEQSAYLRFVEQTDKSKYSYEKEVAA